MENEEAYKASNREDKDGRPVWNSNQGPKRPECLVAPHGDDLLSASTAAMAKTGGRCAHWNRQRTWCQ